MNMLTQTLHKLICALALSITLPVLVTADTFINEVEDTFDTAPGEKLVVKVGSGNVDISSQPGDQLKASILMSVKTKNEDMANQVFEKIETVLEQSDGTILVKAKQRKEKGSWLKFAGPTKVKIAITIQCPENYDVVIDTGSGNIKVRDITGDLSFDSGSGNIIGTNLTGKINADTGSGNIDMTKVEGRVNGDTGSGNIVVKELSGELSGDTGSGNINVSGSISRFDADTGSGNVKVLSDTAITENSKADTGSGNISISLPEDSSFFLKADTSSGKIRNEFPTAHVKSSRKRNLHAQINQGGPTVNADAGSGNVSFSFSN